MRQCKNQWIEATVSLLYALKHKEWTTALSVVLWVTMSQWSFAQDDRLVFSAAVGQSDNITRVPSDTIDEAIGVVGMVVETSGSTRRLTWELDGDLSYQDYDDDTFDSELVGSLSAGADLSLWESRFNWAAQYDFGQTRGDSFDRLTPANRRDLSYFRTGPDLFLEFIDNTFIDLQGRYSTTSFEGEQLDSDRYFGVLGLRRNFSSGTSLSLQLSTETVEYRDAPPSADFDRNAAYLRYRLEGARTKVRIDLGVTEIERTSSSDDGELIAIDITRRISPSQNLQINIASVYSDFGNFFRDSADTTVADQQLRTVQPIADPFRNQSAFLRWIFDRFRTRIRLEVGHGEEEYDPSLQSRDREYTWAAFGFERDLTSRITLELSGSHRDESSVESNDESEYRFGLNWRLTRKFAVNLSAAHFTRNSFNGLTDFDENVYFMRIDFTAFQRSPSR